MKQYFIHYEVICFRKKVFSKSFSRLKKKKISPEIVDSSHLGTPEFFNKLDTTMELMRDIWSANQGAVPKSSHVVEILLSGTYWKVVHSLEVTDTDCDKAHIETPARRNNPEWNKKCRINGEKCYLPIFLLTIQFTLDCSLYYLEKENRHVWDYILQLIFKFLRYDEDQVRTF